MVETARLKGTRHVIWWFQAFDDIATYTAPSQPRVRVERAAPPAPLSARVVRGEALAKEKYAVFISYRHLEPDRRWAVWLHNALESFVIPRPLRRSAASRRIGRVFRDEEELAASSHLSVDIKAALDRSDWLVVECSPRAVTSDWVNAEILHFRELGRDDRILTLLIEGEPKQSFPQGLYQIRKSMSDSAVPDEPLAADGREDDRRNQSSRSHATGQA